MIFYEPLASAVRGTPMSDSQRALSGPRLLDAVGRRERVALEAHTDLLASESSDRIAGVLANV
jgi:hypothetical protein